MPYYRIYLRNFHGRDGYLEVGLNNEQLIQDYEAYLHGDKYVVRSYPLVGNKGGTLSLDFHEVLAIKSVDYAS